MKRLGQWLIDHVVPITLVWMIVGVVVMATVVGLTIRLDGN